MIEEYIEKKIREILENVLSEMKTNENSNNDVDKFLTVDEVVEKYHVSKTTLWRWAKAKYICPKKLGSKSFYSEKELVKVYSKG